MQLSPKLLYIYLMIMRALSCSSFGFRSLFIFCELYVFAYANSNQDDAWINLDDMINYDPRTKSMRIPTQKACTTVQQPTCLPVFKRFISRLLKETTKLGLPDGAKTFMHYDAEVKLSRQMVSEFQKLLKDDKDWKNGALDEALSQFLVNFRLSDHKPWTWRFEETFHVEVDTALKLSLCVLVITAAICTEMWSVVSWFFQFKRIVLICFFISLIWNWLHLYMLAFAEHQKNIVVMERLHEQCTGVKEMTWWDSLLEWYRRAFTLQDDPCKLYYETVLVNPILLVPPTKAFIVTLTYLFTDPLKHIGQGINEFLRALLKDLPVFLQILVFLTIAAPFLVFTCGSALGGVIKHAAVLLPWLGEHPAVVQPQARDDEDLAPQPLHVHQERNRINLVRNTVNQGIRAGDANANVPQNNQEDKRTPQPGKRRSGNAQAVPLETLYYGGISSIKPTHFQQQEEEEDWIFEGEEHEVDDVCVYDVDDCKSTIYEREEKDAQTWRHK